MVDYYLEGLIKYDWQKKVTISQFIAKYFEKFYDAFPDMDL